MQEYLTDRISTGSEIFDTMLDGGYEKGVLTTLYGPSSAGKTNLCLLALIRMTGTGKKVIYIDTESSLSIERLKQITKHYEKVLQNTIFFHPTTFEEQHNIFTQLWKVVNDKIGLIIIDTISMLYRLEMGQKDNIKKINSALAKQIAILIKTAKQHNLPVIVANQVYADFENKNNVHMVGGDILRNGSRCLIEVQAAAHSKRVALLRKHRSLPEKMVEFFITEKGIAKRRN